ncbi:MULTISPECIES: NAD(P)-dependent oxidoreductase [unclassified Pusillimonas]|uniref:NAD(P)-dependent oxidoreductase n=1 Tax=unclassified Pusillimonas TaxID=2640016 RepID=UPI000B94653E|nr:MULTISPECIES: NAD(P)-dependent oxidoreductase [unclassified Pusillimonas]OXR49737.1 3-beta hydroxysteroid dehydrogenase [Pusillimonas sp. T2]ROT45139.1 NAD(P)-dependent oxidoreductase [Pusillimonas sp. NJUB218]
MKIAIIGATGFVGSALLQEAVTRGHEITALVSTPSKVPASDKVTASQVDVMMQDSLTDKLKGHDAVISAFSGHAQTDVLGYYVKGMHSIISAAKAAGVPRLLVVGGAGGLEVAPGVQLIDTPEFPVQWKGTAEGARQALNLLRAEDELDWTVLAPSAHIEPGERTGKFRLGKDQLLTDESGKSHISLADYAVAMMDELEQPAHSRSRFTVGY